MLSGLRWLALEAKYLDRAREFYTTTLDLPVVGETDDEVVLAAGETDLLLRRPASVPRGGVHTHYALATPPSKYDAWYDRLDEDFELTEFDFGGSRSLYFYDPDGNCVEIGGCGAGEGDITSVFEIALEVEDLARAESFYCTLGFEVVDRGDDRPRVRLDGPVALELWEPQLGIADARGGLHVDIGFETEDPTAAAEAVAEQACAVEERGDDVRVRDPDGHYVTFR
ncbi:VOC family protein [Halorussus halophilus]|uniref:VOC family protein n=1 Tax=Halorussus halophilus TaxID=2650975 RepID=UPI00130144CA|nr:VOC family protein [Halorussus halophilus]